MPHYRKDLRKWQGIVLLESGKRKTKLFTSKLDASRWEVDFKEEVNTPVIYTSTQLSDAYLEYSTRFVATVQEEKRRVLNKFVRHCGPKLESRKITPQVALSYVTNERKTRTAVAVNKDLAHLRAMWNWGITFLGLHTPSPFAMVQRYPTDNRKAYIPLEDHFWKVIEVASWRDRIMLLTFLYTGARKGEIFKLTWDDVDFTNRVITLSTRKRKGGNTEYDTLPMIDELFVELLDLSKKKESDLLFPSRNTGKQYKQHYHLLKDLCAKAKVKEFSFHAIRRLTASILASSGVPMVQIQSILRHQNLRTTERYIQPLGMLTDSMNVLARSNRSVSRKNTHRHLQLVSNEDASN